MSEALVVLVLLGGVLLSAALGPAALMETGAVIAALGLLASLAAGFVYHLRLRTVLLGRGPLPRLWWLAPTRFHRTLDPAARRLALPWFRAGAISMGVHGAGLALFLLGALRALWF